MSEDKVGRISFGPRTSLSELRRFAVQQPVDAAHRIAELLAALARRDEQIAKLTEALEEMDAAATDAFGDPGDEDGFDRAHTGVRAALAAVREEQA